MLHLAGPLKDIILGCATEAQEEIWEALKRIEADPSVGEYLPFPWTNGILGFQSNRYFITYRFRPDGDPEVAGITKMPTSEDIQRALQERRRNS